MFDYDRYYDRQVASNRCPNGKHISIVRCLERWLLVLKSTLTIRLLLVVFSACGGTRIDMCRLAFPAYFPLKWLRAHLGKG